MTTAATRVMVGILLVGCGVEAPRPAFADPEALVLREDGAVCVFAGTVTHVDTVRTDRWTRVIRYRFRDVVFARGGNDAREVRFERIVSTPKPVWGTDKGRRVRMSVVPMAPPPLIFEKGVRYVVLADGVALDTPVVQVNQIRGVHKMEPDSSGVMVLEGTDVPEIRYLESFRPKREPPPEPIPAGD